MNKEVIKAMQDKKENKMRKWWRKNHYKVWRVVLFPIWFCVILKEKITTRKNQKQTWNDERATKILNYYIPRRSKWNDEEKYFYFFDNGMGWNLNLAKKYLKRKDYRFWKVNCGFWGGKMRKFLVENFELERFTKEVKESWDNEWTEIIFKLNQ